MRILFIHEVNYLTKPVFEMHEFPEGLSILGHDVGFLHFAEGQRSRKLSGISAKATVVGRAHPCARITLYTPRYMNGKMLGRLEAAIRAHKTIQETINDFTPQLIVCFAVPTFGWQALRVAAKNNVPMIFRSLDASHLIRKGPWSYFVRLAERYIARNSKAISANNLAMKEYQIKLGADPSRVSVHYPYLETEAYRGGSRERVREVLGLNENSRVIMYLGSFFYFSGLLQVLSSFSELNRCGDCALVLVGGGEQEAELRRMAIELQIKENVIFAGFVPFKEIGDYLAAADVVINPMVKEQVSDVALPNKVIQYLAAGKPVVTTSLRGLEATFSDFSGLIWVSDPGECITEAHKLLVSNHALPTRDSVERLQSMFGLPALYRFESYLAKALTST